MNLVVNFLSMLVTEEENGGVKRMLGVCSEFERIAKVVLDKAEKETSSRKKRKNNEDQGAKARGLPPKTPLTANAQIPSMANVFSPGMAQTNQQNGFGSSPMNGNGGSPGSNWQPDFGNGSDYMTPNGNRMTPFADIPGYTNGNEINSPLNINNFKQPFVPQDLWQMPMTLEWDWADMTGGAYPSFENGIVGDPALQHNGNQHLQHMPHL